MKIAKFLLSLVVLNACTCQDSLQLVTVYGEDCYTQNGEVKKISRDSREFERKNNGECITGKTDLNAKKELICAGEIKPKQELCNGLDDDCNGTIDDEYVLMRNSGHPENTCIGPGVCKRSTQICENGIWICSRYFYGEEICDGRDNDCDGEVDEDTEEDPIFDPEDRYVYRGDQSTINIGECRAGYRECQDGHENIRNMRTPTMEVCGNGDDDDCDGLTDEIDGAQVQSDYVLILDFSGSMYTIIDSVATALCDWATQRILNNSRFAVVAIGYVLYPEPSPLQIEILTDFTDPESACYTIQSANVISNAGGDEYQLDAIYGISNSNSDLHLSWTGLSKKVLIFSDEGMQYTIAPTLYESLEMISDQCIEQNYMIGAFISYFNPNQYYWVELTNNCNGFLDYLNDNPQVMINSLNYWIGGSC